jgi:outer membrane lipoprotein
MCRTLTLVLILAGNGLAFATVPDWRGTIDQDLQGPRVDVTGEIVSRMSAGEHTCFVVERAGGKFIACNTGHFDPAVFAPGAPLKAVGNLGAAVPRDYGGHVYDYPLVAGALISLGTRRDYYDADPYYGAYGPYYGHPFYDPFYRPFYGPGFYGPHFGTGIFFHIH